MGNTPETPQEAILQNMVVVVYCIYTYFWLYPIAAIKRILTKIYLRGKLFYIFGDPTVAKYYRHIKKEHNAKH